MAGDGGARRGGGDEVLDVVGVGGGSAGCVVAGRLSEDPALGVCLLEAGPDRSPANVRIPAAFSRLYRTEMDRDHRTVPQGRPYDREIYWPRGRMVGGFSAMNAQIHVRGHEEDFRSWVRDGRILS